METNSITIKIYECPYIGCNLKTTKTERLYKHIDEKHKTKLQKGEDEI